MAKYQVGDILKVHYDTCFEADIYVVRAVLSAGSFSPEMCMNVGDDAYIWENENGRFSWDRQIDIDNEQGLVCTLISRDAVKQEPTSDAYPHTCEYCGSPCWNGMNFICSNPNCITKGQ